VARLATSVQVTRWLNDIGFPSVEPLPVEQPVAGDGYVVTFWRYLPQDGPEPMPADLGFLLRRPHGLGSPPAALPTYRPLVSVRAAIASSRAIDDEERAWLEERCEQLLHDRFLHGAAPLKPLPEPVDLDLYRVRRQARVGGVINEYRLVASHVRGFRHEHRYAWSTFGASAGKTGTARKRRTSNGIRETTKTQNMVATITTLTQKCVVFQK
jgi:hypothetical protein